MSPLISVIIPIYNMESYLPRCLDSILANTYQNLEILCVDDGSRDRSLEILQQYAEKAPRIVVIAKENGGVSSARNAGLDRVNGDYVCFIDPDDFVHPKYFELLLEALERTETAVSCCAYRIVAEKDLPVEYDDTQLDHSAIRLCSTEQFFKNHTARSFCWGKLFRREMLHSVWFRENLKYSEDSVFVAETWERRDRAVAAVIPNHLYYYYQREQSLVKTARLSDRLEAARLFVAKALQSGGNDVIYLDQALKRSLSTRYYATHIHPDREIARTCSALLRSCRKRLKATSIYSRKDKFRYSVFIRFPGIYWLYRSITEPYMWRWEKVERKKRRAAKKAGNTTSE